MQTLNEQRFHFRVFMRRRGWNSIVSITLLSALIMIIILKAQA